jgi:hypothetical protein
VKNKLWFRLPRTILPASMRRKLKYRMQAVEEAADDPRVLKARKITFFVFSDAFHRCEWLEDFYGLISHQFTIPGEYDHALKSSQS